MISRSHFDSRLVGFKVWCHYSEGVRKKKQTGSSAGERWNRNRVGRAGAQLGWAGTSDREKMYKAADDCAHGLWSPL